MDFIVEDGTGLPNATSLTTVEWADQHLAATGYAPEWENLDDEVKKARLNTATSIFANSFSFYGYLLSETQSLPFPRKDLRDREGRLILGVPPIVRSAVAELAYYVSQENPFTDSELAELESIKVGPISLEVSSLARETKVLPDSIIRAVSEYGRYRFGKNRMRKLVAG